MQTLKNTPHQTLKGMIASLEKLATQYAETGAAEALEAGKHPGNSTGTAHHNNAIYYMGEARELTEKAEYLKRHLDLRKAQESAPAIDKNRDTMTVTIHGIGNLK